MTIKIVSAAQHAMLEKASNDPAYAKSRGIDQELAKASLLAHANDGMPKLPDRVSPKDVAPRAKKSATVFMTSNRG